MSEMTKKVEEQLAIIANTAEETQHTVKELKGTIGDYDKDKLDRIAKDAADAIEKLGEMKAAEKFAEMEEQIKEQQTEIKTLSGVLARGGSAEDTENVQEKRNFLNYLRKGVEPTSEEYESHVQDFARKTLPFADDRQLERFTKELVAGSGPDGGYSLMSDRSNVMIERIFETSPLRGMANMETTTSDVFEYILDDDEADAGWVGEVDARPNTDTPTIGVVKIPLHEVYAQPRITQKLLDDAGFDIEGWLQRKAANRIGRRENEAFVNGSGSQRPQGFLSYDNYSNADLDYERGRVQRITSSTSGSFTANDLINLKNTLFEEYQANSMFAMDRETFTPIMQFTGSDGQYLLNPQIIMQGAEKMLLGSQVMFLNDMPEVAANSLSICIADWSEFYTIVDRFDIRVLRDPYTQKPYVRYYTTKRTGGAVTNYQAGKILQIAA